LLLVCFVSLVVSGGMRAAAQDADPPARVARLNYIQGNVSMQPAGVTDWAPAEPNRPFTTGDNLFTDVQSRAELHSDFGVIRSGQQTTAGFLALNDQTAQIRLVEGDLYVTLRELDPNQVVEIDTPNAAVSLLRTGVYRFRVNSNDGLTFVVVHDGQAEITGGGQAFTLNPGNSASLTGTDQLNFVIEPAPEPDDLDSWCADRDAHEARLASARYLPRSVVGYEDLDDYGAWDTVPEYGSVWYPRVVVAGWAPYHYGHWAWIEPWGWTWVDNAPWGFAPFHYGRWAFIAGRWGWCPGPIVVVANRPPVVRPVYAPALVAWFGGAHWGVSVRLGGGPSLGWVPLGFGEVYTPSYHCSPHYFNRVNVSNTTIVRNVNITNVYNTVYVNKTVYNQRFVNVQAPNAVSAMPQNAFASGRPVHLNGTPLRAEDLRQLQPSQAAVVAPPVAPTRQAILATAVARPSSRPPAQIALRPVVVRTAPATVPAPFVARQAYLQQHAGEPHDFASMHRQVQTPAPPPPVIRAPQPSAIHVQPQQSPTFRSTAATSSTPPPPPVRRQQEQPVPPVHSNNPPQPPANNPPPAFHNESHPQPSRPEVVHPPNERVNEHPQPRTQPPPPHYPERPAMEAPHNRPEAQKPQEHPREQEHRDEKKDEKKDHK
jgi:hypothetical protein